MDESPEEDPRSGRRAFRRLGWPMGGRPSRGRVLACVVLAALGGWCGCSVTKSNYSTWTFFFDGVPDPSAAVGAPGGDQTVAVSVVVHAPFGEEKCESCHRTQYRPQRNDPSACISCHGNVAERLAWTHGAVAGGACLWCHSPHESARRWLLRGPDRQVCMQCHPASTMNGTDVPAHVDPTASCLGCHFGHGGASPTMLRPGATATVIPPPVEEPKEGSSEKANSEKPAEVGEPAEGEKSGEVEKPAEAEPSVEPELPAGPARGAW
jgi:predicted CXXCH cytochrome family protein